jgi:hypothetical protein
MPATCVRQREPQACVNLERETGALTDALDQAIDGIRGETRGTRDATVGIRRKYCRFVDQGLASAWQAD